MEFGLFSCYGSACKQLESFNKAFQPSQKEDEEQQQQQEEEQGQEASNASYTEGDPLINFPPIKLPTRFPQLPPVEIPPINMPHSNDDVTIPIFGPPSSGQIEAQYKEMVAEAEAPFKYAAIATLICFALSFLVMFGTLGDLFYNVELRDHLFYGVALSMVLLVLAPILYLFFTIAYLNGGQYLEGMLLTVYCSLLGLVFSGAGVFLMLNEKRDYIPLRDNESVNIELGTHH